MSERVQSANPLALELRGLVKDFGTLRALAGVDLRVEAGEFLVVLGPTGAGKTTLLRTIAGLETPDAGTLTLFGRDARALAPAERDVALVFQNFSLYPGKTVRANLEFPLRAPGREHAESEIRERVEWAASLLHIERLLERPARALSGGEMQRVAIGRAIVRRPKLFLMDEPLTNLDAKLREELRAELRELARRLETPVLWVTHDQAEALTMADRVAVLVAGRVLQEGRPEEVYARPVSPLVARQLGTPPMNVSVARRVGESWVALDGTVLVSAANVASANATDATTDATAHAARGERATLGIRPEHLELDGGSSEGVVEVVEDLGPARVLLVRWAGSEWHVLVARDRAARPGDRVRPRFAPERVVMWNDA